MIKLETLKNFHDVYNNKVRAIGEVFFAPEERAKVLLNHELKLVRLVDVPQKKTKTETILLSLTYKELQKLASDKGIKSVGVKKDKLIEQLQ